MAVRGGWWSIEFDNGEPEDWELERIGAAIAEGYTSGEYMVSSEVNEEGEA